MSQSKTLPQHLLIFATLTLAMAGWCCDETPSPGMARVAGGVFRPFFTAPGDPKEVVVKTFALDILPVRNGDFLEFVRVNPRWQRSRVKRIFADDAYLKNWAGDLELGPEAAMGAPVTYVSWFAAKAYADWKGKRLPAVAEWEYAARAGFSRPDGENDSAFEKQVLQWYATPSPARLPPAGGGRPNFWGIQDLHGLVWEWTADFNTAMVSGDGRNDTGPDAQLFCGGGSQRARDPRNYAAFMRYGFRSSLKADYCVRNLGFRCAKDL